MLPIIQTLRETTRETLRADLLAGLTTAIMLVPQSMAYAMLAGLEPIVGLYAATVPLILYALFGSSRPLAVGPVAMDSLMTAAGLLPLVAAGTESYAAAAALLALLVGGIQVGLGLLRAGFLVRFLAQPVILGFTAAAAIVIGLSQLKSALGVDLPRSQQVHVILLAAAEHITEAHGPTLLITALSVTTLLGLKKVAPRFPRFLLVVAAGTLAVWGLGLADQGVAVVGDVPAGLPPIGFPSVELSLVPKLLPVAFAISLVAMMEAISVAKRYDTDVDSNRELTSLGMANLGSGLVGGYPVTGGFSRTAVNHEAGARTPLAGIITSGLVMLTLLFLTEPFRFLPKAVLASIIMTAVFGLIDIRGMVRLYRTCRMDFAVAMITFVATLTAGIQLGMATGVIASLIAFLMRTAKPTVWDASSSEEELVVRVSGPLYFGNVDAVREGVEALEEGRTFSRVVVDVEGHDKLDSVAQGFLEDLTRQHEERGVPLEVIHHTERTAPSDDVQAKAS